jgi:RNA polymerase sigma factor (TIGR02999 family)
MPDDSGEITRLLREWRAGSADAENDLFQRVYADLRRIAHARLRGEGSNRPVQTTELVDQIYLRLVAAKDRDWHNRQHFFAIAGRAMRHYLIDLARARPDVDFIGLDNLEKVLRPGAAPGSTKVDAAISLGRLLEQLEKENPPWCHLVELKFFLGLTDEEAANVLGISLRTMQRMWRDARRWLFERMEPGDGNQVPN